MDLLQQLVDSSDFPPRWLSGRWTVAHVGLDVVSDLAIWAAYLVSSCILARCLVRRRPTRLRAGPALFAAFFLVCGTMHLMGAVSFWWPAYRLAGLIKLVAALISWATVVYLIARLPRLLMCCTCEEVEAELAARQQADAALRRTNALLEQRIDERAGEALHAGCQVRAERLLLKTTLESIADAVIITDGRGRVVSVNGIAEELTGWSQDEAQGQPLEEIVCLLDEQTGQPMRGLAHRVPGDGIMLRMTLQVLLRSKSGTLCPIDLSVAPIRDDAASALGVVLVLSEVSERMRREVQLKEKVRESRRS